MADPEVVDADLGHVLGEFQFPTLPQTGFLLYFFKASIETISTSRMACPGSQVLGHDILWLLWKGYHRHGAIWNPYDRQDQGPSCSWNSASARSEIKAASASIGYVFLRWKLRQVRGVLCRSARAGSDQDAAGRPVETDDRGRKTRTTEARPVRGTPQGLLLDPPPANSTCAVALRWKKPASEPVRHRLVTDADDRDPVPEERCSGADHLRDHGNATVNEDRHGLAGSGKASSPAGS